MFPAGLPGIALLVLRNCIAFALGGSAFPSGWQHAAYLLLLSMLCFGLFTPVVCGIAIAAILFNLAHSPAVSSANIVVLALSTLSLALLGPGAFSIDARMFGRRILISSASSNPGAGEQK
jgi:hypothetical protein